MNWERIKSECPKALEKLYDHLLILDISKEEHERMEIEPRTRWEYFQSEYLTGQFEGFNWNVRNLFGFFDEHEVLINISCSPLMKQPFYCIIYFKEMGVMTGRTFMDYKSRTAAETAAFEKAFEILEKRLNDEK